MVKAYHLVGLSHCALSAFGSKQFHSDYVSRQAVIGTFDAVLSEGVIKSSRALGVTGPTPLDYFAGDDDYVFMASSLDQVTLCSEDQIYGFVFDAGHLIQYLSAGIRPDDMLGVYVLAVIEAIDFSMVSSETDYTLHRDIINANMAMSYGLDVVDEYMQRGMADTGSVIGQERLARLEHIVGVLEQVPKKVQVAMRKLAHRNTKFGKQAQARANTWTLGWELVVPRLVPLDAAIGKIVAGKEYLDV
jgi:hypothetical protein